MQRKTGLLAVLLTMLFLYQADATIVNVATPALRADLGASGAQLELVIGGYLVASATLLIIGARLGQVYGYRRVFLTGISIFGLASLLCGAVDSPVALIAARVLQGLGGALAFPQVLTGIQTDFAEGVERTRALGLYSIALASGAVSGQILGGVLVSADVFGLGWRPIFLVNVPIALATVAAGRRVLPVHDVSASPPRLDLRGAATLSAAVLLVVLPLTLGRESGWPVWTWAALAASAPLLALFAWLEHGHRAPLVDLRVISRAPIARGILAQSFAVSTYFALLFCLALYMQRGLGHSALVSGLTLVPWVAAFGLPGRVLGRLPARWRTAAPVLGSLILASAYAAISASMLTGAHGELLLMALLAVGGFGLGTQFSALLVLLTDAATPRHAADISGVFTTSSQIAGAIGVAGFGALYLGQSTGASHAFGVVTAVFVVVALMAAATAFGAVRSVARAAA